MVSVRPDQRLIVALGASNTAGYGVGPDKAFPAVLERLLQGRGLAAQVVNAGISGHTTGQMLERMDRDIPEGTALVIFQPGSNDIRKALGNDLRERNIEIIQCRLRGRGIPVVRVAAAFEAVRSGNLQADGIHFTARGHELIAAHILDDVITALAGSGSDPAARADRSSR